MIISRLLAVQRNLNKQDFAGMIQFVKCHILHANAKPAKIGFTRCKAVLQVFKLYAFNVTTKIFILELVSRCFHQHYSFYIKFFSLDVTYDK